jgi:hypothetical protein
MPGPPDPVFEHSRREGLIIMAVWLASTIFCCSVCYFLGYIRPDRPLGPDDVHPVFGIPAWMFWGVIVPWLASAVFTFWFAGWYMADDDLGSDHAAELESDIREGGLDE